MKLTKDQEIELEFESTIDEMVAEFGAFEGKEKMYIQHMLTKLKKNVLSILEKPSQE